MLAHVKGRGRHRKVYRRLYMKSAHIPPPYSVGGRSWPYDYYDVYIGEYERPNQLGRSLMLMQTMEAQHRTEHWIYDAARKIAMRELCGRSENKRAKNSHDALAAAPEKRRVSVLWRRRCTARN